MAVVRKALVAAFVAFTALCGMLFVIQERLLFPGAYVLPDDAAARSAVAHHHGVIELGLRTTDGATILAWHYSADADRAVIYVGGNAQPIERSVALGGRLNEAGWDLLTIAPRGFPGSPGTPGQQAFGHDLSAAWRHATTRLRLPPERVVLHGTSMGGGIVGTKARELPAAGFVFESTFDSVTAMAKRTYPWLPVGWLLRHPFDTVGDAPHIYAPSFQAHWQADRVIPVAHARRLAEALHDVTYVEAPGGSHDHSVLLRDDATRARWLAWLDRVVPRAAAPPP